MKAILGKQMKVSVIVINFNSTDYTVNCVNSILEKTQSKVEVVIVDNNSIEEERDKLSQWLEGTSNNIKYVESKKNTGFSMGNMLGANVASGEYLFFLNNDCILLNSAIDELVTFMDTHQDAGISGPKIFDGKGKYTPSFNYTPSVANKWLGSSICRLFNKDLYLPRRVEYKSPVAVQMIPGSAMFFRRKCFNLLGGLDTNFFLYCEEEDISIRAKKSGYKVYHVPTAEITHYFGSSTKRNIEIEKEFYISFFYMLEKNYSFFSRNLIKLRYLIKEFFKLFKGKGSLALLWFLLKGPSLSQSMRHRMEFR